MPMVYAQCKDEKALYELMYGKKYPALPVSNSPYTVESLHKREKIAEDTWREILAQHQHKLDESGFIEVGIDEQREIFIKTGRPGRPMKLQREAVKEQKISLRLDLETFEKLEAFSKKYNIPISEAARIAIQNHVNEKDIELLKL